MSGYTRQSFSKLAKEIGKTGRFSPEDYGLVLKDGYTLSDIQRVRSEALSLSRDSGTSPARELTSRLKKILKKK